MITNSIKSIKPINKVISFVIHINNICNFMCDYCIAWQQFSKDTLSFEKVSQIIDNIKKLSSIYSNHIIEVDLTWWEPILHENIIEIIDKFLSLENVNLQISTNAYLLSFLGDKFNNKKILKNKNKLFFNISYHYFEYKDKVDWFIKSINVLDKYNLNYNIKFLLPDNNESLSNFLFVKEYILSKISIDKWNYTFSLIIDTEWNISKTYKQEILDYYFKWNNSKNNPRKKNYENVKVISDNIKENKLQINTKKDLNKSDFTLKHIKVEFDNWNKEEYLLEEFKSLWLMNFKWYDCHYISENYLTVYIYPNGKAVFWPCYTLDSMKYDIEEIWDLILSWNKKLVCSEMKCISWIFFPKTKTLNYEKTLKLEKLIITNLENYLWVFSIVNVAIFLEKNIQITLKLNTYYIYYFIEKKLENNYIFNNEKIGYYYSIKNNNNINCNINSLEKSNQKLIHNMLVTISKLDKIYNYILFNEK